MSDDTHGEIALAIASARAGIAQLDNALQNLGDLMVGLLSISATPTAGLFGPPLQALALSNATFVTGIASGTLIGNILNRTPGAALSIVPSEGRVALNGAGDQLLTGLTAASAGTFTVTLRETLAGSPNSPRDTTLTLTVSQSATTPNPFSFPAVTGAALNTLVQSADITLTGVSSPAPFTALGSTEVSTNSGASWSTTGTYNPGSPIRVRGTSAPGNSIKRTFSVNVGGVMGTVGGTTGLVGGTTGGFDVTTLAGAFQVPTDILSDVVLWGTAYDPATLFSDDGVTAVTEGGALYRANDKSTHGYHFKQATSASRPIYSATSFFGSPGLTFDGVNDFLRAQGITLGTDKFSLFLSIIPLNDEANDRYVSFAGNLGNVDYADSSNVVWLSDNTGTGSPGFTTFNSYRNGASLGSTQYAHNTPYRVAVIYDGTNGKLYVNNVAGGTSSSAGVIGTTGDLFMGAGWSGSATGNYGKCVIQSWCIARGDITSGQRAAMDAWLQAPTGVAAPSELPITGLKAAEDSATTGSMAAGSLTLTVANAAGLQVGDPIIVEPGGEVDQWHSVGGMWPFFSAPTVAALPTNRADIPASNNSSGVPQYHGFYAYITTNGDGHLGEVWKYSTTLNGWERETITYWRVAKPLALLATITAKSGNTLTLDKPAVHATTNANVYFNNQPALLAISGGANTTFKFPASATTKTYIVGNNSAPGVSGQYGITITNRVGWTIDGLDRTKTRLKHPKGVPSIFFYVNLCNNVLIKNIGMDSNLGIDYGGLRFPKPGDVSSSFEDYLPREPAANQHYVCTGGGWDTCEVTNVMQQAFGGPVSDAVYADNCNAIQTIPFTSYTQWLYLWSDCGSTDSPATGGTRNCTINCTYLTAGAEMFRSYGIKHVDLVATNGLLSINSSTNCEYIRPQLTYTTNCISPLSDPNIVRNPCINVNSNVDTFGGSHAAGAGNKIIDAKVIQQGYANTTTKDILSFALALNGVEVSSTSTRRSTHVEDYKGYFECPNYDATSIFRGADMRLDGDGTVVDNIRIVGTTQPGLTTLGIDHGLTAAGSGSVTNCVLPAKADGTPSVDGGDVHTNNITNATWLGGG